MAELASMFDESVAWPSWRVEVDGCTNFRDAGGWRAGDRRMRTKALYRSDDPVRATELGRSAVAELGLRHVVDLRQLAQFERGPGFLPREQTAHIPLVDRVIDPDNPPTLETAADMTELYVGMLGRSGDQIAAALDSLAEHVADGPVLVHCAFGKDRAGLVVAAVQAAIGLDADAIVEDYARSDGPARRRRAWIVAEPLPGDPDTSKVPEFLFTAPPAAMRMLTGHLVADHGSLEDWARSFPTRPDTIDRLRDALLD